MMHPTTRALLEFFAWEHLPPHLAAVSKKFDALAHDLAEIPGPETTAGLRKLLEAKDCAVRAAHAAHAAATTEAPRQD